MALLKSMVWKTMRMNQPTENWYQVSTGWFEEPAETVQNRKCPELEVNLKVLNSMFEELIRKYFCYLYTL
jgi:hypothetical protein